MIRIIGGKWRSRKLSVPNTPWLRPTPDRIRETVFNWLTPHLEGARCLDLFCGTGVLGLEALSRGALTVTAIEKDPVLVQNLSTQAKILGANLQIVRDSVERWLTNTPTPFDIVFLDPPYSLSLLPGCLEQLRRGWLSPKALVYTESNEPLRTPPHYQVVKHKKAGRIYFYLLTPDAF